MRASVNGTELYFDVDGAELRLGDDGLRPCPTIVVLHGGPGFDQGYLRPGVGLLREHAQLLFVDLRGQGRSGRPPLETCTLEQMADDVASLCALLGVRRPIVLGHSAGGFVALHLALRDPDRVRALVLCSTSPTLAPTADGEGNPSLESRASPEACAAAGRFFGGDLSPEAAEAFQRLVSPYYAGPAHPDAPGRTFPLSRFELDVARHFFSGQGRTYDLRPRLGEIRVPTLVLSGGYDWVCPPSAGRALARGIPGARLEMVPEAGHLLYTEEPEAFVGAVSGFIGGLPAP